MEDSSEGRWLTLISCPPSYHPSLTQARMVGGHHHQVVSHQRNSKTSFLGSETAASLTHMFIFGVHARLPTCTQRQQKCQRSVFTFIKKKKKENHGTRSTLISHDPSPTLLYTVSCTYQRKPCLHRTASQNYGLS